MRSIAVAACALVLASCGSPSYEEVSLEELLEARADFVNNEGRNELPYDLPGEMLVRIEGDILVMRLTNWPMENYIIDANLLQRQLRSEMCRHEANRILLERGGRFGLELVSNTGAEAPMVMIARCPSD